MAEKGAQGSLEYIIIIGGVIIIAAATYFMLKGFAQTTGAGTTEAMGVAGDKFRLELENLGRAETRFITNKWGSYPQLSKLILNNTGPATTSDITLFNLSDYGLNLSEIEFAYNDSGAIKTLGHTIEQPGNPDSPVTFTSQTLPAGSPAVPSSTEILLFHNDSGADELDNLNYTSSDPDVNVTEDGGTSPVQSPDISPPTIVISSTAFGSAGSVKDADIEVTVADATSPIIEVMYSIDNSPYFRADNLFYGYQDIALEGHPEDYSYGSNSETIHIIATVPEEDNYTIRVRAVDEYSNERVETQNVSIVLGSLPGDSTPPAILSTEPANNTIVQAANLTINLTTNENAYCRFDIAPVSFLLMENLNVTGGTMIHMLYVTCVDETNYKYYFRCNDTYGNVNETDYVLNFSMFDGICRLGESTGSIDCDAVCDPEDESGSPDCDGICDVGDDANSPDCDSVCNSGDDPSNPACDGLCNLNDEAGSPDCDGACDYEEDAGSPDCDGACNIGDYDYGADCDDGFCDIVDEAGSPNCEGYCDYGDETGSADCDGACDYGDSGSGVDCDSCCNVGDEAGSPDCDGSCAGCDEAGSPDCP